MPDPIVARLARDGQGRAASPLPIRTPNARVELGTFIGGTLESRIGGGGHGCLARLAKRGGARLSVSTTRHGDRLQRRKLADLHLSGGNDVPGAHEGRPAGAAVRRAPSAWRGPRQESGRATIAAAGRQPD